MDTRTILALMKTNQSVMEAQLKALSSTPPASPDMPEIPENGALQDTVGAMLATQVTANLRGAFNTLKMLAEVEGAVRATTSPPREAPAEDIIELNTQVTDE